MSPDGFFKAITNWTILLNHGVPDLSIPIALLKITDAETPPAALASGHAVLTPRGANRLATENAF